MFNKINFSLEFLLAASGRTIYHWRLDNNLPFSPHDCSNDGLEVTWLAGKTNASISLTEEVCNLRAYYYRDLELHGRTWKGHYQGILLLFSRLFAARQIRSIPTGFPSPHRKSV
jgi:hypothetical protein